ncbi:protein of unknown function [Denitratisoma oestradiolicum]|uniref:Uncharacterized protein n=1 Tax=Denitratisoma oestradiolicum TaxID=311182 RepID=A0A6S6YMZ0_9PROT|nr:protein of unknown function [Denitratisoma oestradiolicum]
MRNRLGAETAPANVRPMSVKTSSNFNVSFARGVCLGFPFAPALFLHYPPNARNSANLAVRVPACRSRQCAGYLPLS